ncbi:hypothetical protein [Pedobacter nototheniae]|uniref:hypothetical protein n=1 Tax=Pedobacter nototheniae TaxID=2488994 RepID=UPI00292CF44A|nr:hypothetical protein [Pedobacter nototheniae]
MKKHIIVFISIFCFIIKANAQTFILSQFEIQSSYLVNNTLKVTNVNGETPFKFQFAIQRGALSTGGYESGNCAVTIIYTESLLSLKEATSAPYSPNYESDPSTIELSVTKNLTSSDYNYATATLFNDKSIGAKLPTNKRQGKILLRYKFYDTQKKLDIIRYSNTRYSITVTGTDTQPTGGPYISNNIISFQEDTQGLNFPKIIGTEPLSNSSTSFSYDWDNIENDGTPKNIPGPNRKDYNYPPQVGKAIRRVAKDGYTLSYSNVITFPLQQPNSFTITKTPMYDVNGSLTGNKIKILQQIPDASVRFHVILLGPDDPYPISVNSNYEFIIPLYYNNVISSDYEDSRNFSVNISTNTGNSGFIIPTWRTGTDTFK